MAMHDIIHNAPGDSLQTILTRQGPSGIGGIDLASLPKNQAIFSYPFPAERVAFMQNFYTYVCEVLAGAIPRVSSHPLRNILTLSFVPE
jgi:hypothetical protein